MEEAPNPKPVMHSTTVARFSTQNTTDRPRSPSPATHRPITDPERNAIFRAFAMPDSSAAAAVLTFPNVATFIPKNPASTDSSAPIRYRIPVVGLMNRLRRTQRTTMTTAMNLYSLFRNANAPSRMNPEISFILSFPSPHFLIHDASPKAVTSAITAQIGATNFNI